MGHFMSPPNIKSVALSQSFLPPENTKKMSSTLHDLSLSVSPLTSTLHELVYEFESPHANNSATPANNPSNSPLKRSKSPSKGPRKRRSIHTNLAKTAVGLRELAKKMGETSLVWEIKPASVLIVTKLSDSSLFIPTIDLASWLLSQGMTAFVQSKLMDEYSKMPTAQSKEIHDNPHNLLLWEEETINQIAHRIDFVITFGGDGTVLFAAWLFQQKVPPILPFNLGSLGFLTMFESTKVVPTINDILDNEKGMRMNFRMRFKCTISRKSKDNDHGSTFQVLNDLVVDRGPSPYLSNLELFGNNAHLTTVQADGLVIATPTGSTAYSLSAGGAVVHPDVSAILVTPICPHTLSFRPMILPDTMEIVILVPEDSRSTAWVSFDGRHRVNLKAGDSVKIQTSQFPVPTVCATSQSEDWFQGLEYCLAWNKRNRQKQLE